jgi:hypothetical protein
VTAPTAIGAEKLGELLRKELRLLARNLGEEIIGGPRRPRREDGSHRTADLDRIGQEGREALRGHLERWSPPPGPGRVLLLVSLWEESWRLLDYSLAYRTLEVARCAAGEFSRHAAASPAGQPAFDWEAYALGAVGQAMCLITTDATLFQLINL